MCKQSWIWNSYSDVGFKTPDSDMESNNVGHACPLNTGPGSLAHRKSCFLKANCILVGKQLLKLPLVIEGLNSLLKITWPIIHFFSYRVKIRLIKFARCNYNRRPANLRLTKLQFLLNKHNPIELPKSYPSYPDFKSLDFSIRNNDHLTLNLECFRFEKSKKVGIDFYQNSKWRVGSLIGDPSIFRWWSFELTAKYGRKSNNLVILKGAFQFKNHWFATVNIHIAHGYSDLC